MKILISGSEGNIGKRLVPYLISRGHVVYCVDQIQNYRDNYSVVNIMCQGDIFSAFLDFKPELCIHLAAMVSRVTCEKSPHLTIDTNLSGLNNIIQACKSFNARLMYFSTSEVYGNIGGYLSEERVCKPNNLYGLTKYLGEKLVEYETTDSIIVRPFMFYDEQETRGEHRSAMIRFADNLRKNQKITVHSNSIRSWLHISDGVRIIESLIHSHGFVLVNVGSDEIITTENLAKMMCDHLGIKYEDYAVVSSLPHKMTLEKYPDIRKQLSLTGIEPKIKIAEGIKLVIDYDKKN